MSIRPVKRIVQSTPTMEGAGVKLRRAFGFGDTAETDPFLLLDDFRNDRPQDYLAGFPWHPHRGIETITYVLNGTVEHGDSLGNRGTLGSGDVQWMTAGRGIMHQEMPLGDAQGRMHGFQLWANLPSSLKMTAPRYQDVTPDQIPDVDLPGAHVRLIAGEAFGVVGPAQTRSPIFYAHVSLEPGATLDVPAPADHSAMTYALRGPDEGVLTVFNGDGDEIHLDADDEPVEVLVLTGRPLREPVARYGPFVMNTRDEVVQAFEDFQAGRMGAITR